MAEKTEPPTPKRIQDARKKGQFLFSKEVVSVSTLAAVAAVVISLKGNIFEHIVKLMKASTQVEGNVMELASEIAVAVILTILTFSLAAYFAAAISSIFANLFQVGLVFSGAKLTKGLQSLNAINNAKQMFSKKNLLTFFLNICKVLIIGYVCYYVINSLFRDIVLSPDCGMSCITEVGTSAFIRLTMIVTAVFIPVAAIDYLIQRYLYLSELKMSLEDIKQEFKETEGNPEIKGQRKQLHRELVMSDTRQKAAKSNVMVTNPTHCAVALRYVDGETPLPLVMAKGEGTIAKMLTDIAKQEKIPIYQDINLAWQLFTDAELDQYIPEHLLRSVAVVIMSIQNQR